jgi:HlyD family secretion protein
MTDIVMPLPVRSRRKRILLVLAAPFLVLLAAAGLFLSADLPWPRGGPTISGTFHTVGPMDMVITIRKDGELQAVNNVDISCMVEGSSTIQDIVKEGSTVAKGDVLVTLDSSEIARKVQDAEIAVQKAEADLIAAREQKIIQESKNVADLEAAEVELHLARLDLQEYEEGTYPHKLEEAQRAVTMARIGLTNKTEELENTRDLHTRGFVTVAEMKKAELEELTARNELEKKVNELKVLVDYTHEKEIADKRNKLVQAERKLARVKNENASNLSQKVADEHAKEQTLVLQKRQLEHLQKQLEYCTITAPADGLVVYGSTGQMHRWREQPIQPGARVQQQELLIRLPDTSQMKAVARIQEQQVTRLRLDPDRPIRAMVRIVGVTAPIGATVSNISVMADSSQRWWNPDLKEYPVDLVLDHTPQGLKPGNTVHVEIFVDRLTGVVAVPLTTLYSVGGDSYVFARRPNELVPVRVKIGATNETHAEIQNGLSAGQDVLILQAGQGRELLEKAGIKVTAERQAEDDQLPDDV